MNPAAGILTISAALGLLLLIVHWTARFPGISGEARRKTVHVGMGALTLTFPWLFQGPGPVWILALVATVALWALRAHAGLRRSVGQALHGVPRTSWGELCFPWSVAMVFWLAKGDAVSFGVPVLLLTLADAAGALAGVRYGTMGFRTSEGGTKSVEGSIAVFGVSFLCAHLPLLLLTEMGRAECVCAALTLALMVMLMESVSVRGLDNAIIPLGAFFLLQIYRDLPAADLFLRFSTTAGLLVLVILTRRWNGLDASATLGSALLAYGVYAMGGWLFLTPLLGFYARHLTALALRPALRRYRHGISAVLSLTATALPWAGWHYLYGLSTLWPFALAVCLHSAVNYDGGLMAHRPLPGVPRLLQAAGLSALFSLVPAGFIHGGAAIPLAGGVALLPLVMLLCRRVLPRQEDGCYAISEIRFLIQSALLFAATGLYHLCLI